MPKLRANHSEQYQPPSVENDGDSLAATISVASPDAAALGQAPPHQIWASFESAFADPKEPPLNDRRFPLYIALPINIAIALGMWAVIGGLVLIR